MDAEHIQSDIEHHRKCDSQENPSLRNLHDGSPVCERIKENAREKAEIDRGAPHAHAELFPADVKAACIILMTNACIERIELGRQLLVPGMAQQRRSENSCAPERGEKNKNNKAACREIHTCVML